MMRRLHIFLKDCSSQDSPEACYEMVEEEEELQAVYKVFEQMLDDGIWKCKIFGTGRTGNSGTVFLKLMKMKRKISEI